MLSKVDQNRPEVEQIYKLYKEISLSSNEYLESFLISSKLVSVTLKGTCILIED